MHTLKSQSGWPSRGYGRFQEAFLATLVILGCETVATRNEEHHRRFGCAMERLRELQREGESGADLLPSAMYPTAVTGFYTDIQEALMRFDGFVRVSTPFNGMVRITLGASSARQILDDLLEVPPEAQAVLVKICEAFLGQAPTQAAR